MHSDKWLKRVESEAGKCAPTHTNTQKFSKTSKSVAFAVCPISADFANLTNSGGITAESEGGGGGGG
jgi:hypothetical protein